MGGNALCGQRTGARQPGLRIQRSRWAAGCAVCALCRQQRRGKSGSEAHGDPTDDRRAVNTAARTGSAPWVAACSTYDVRTTKTSPGLLQIFRSLLRLLARFPNVASWWFSPAAFVAHQSSGCLMAYTFPQQVYAPLLTRRVRRGRTATVYAAKGGSGKRSAGSKKGGAPSGQQSLSARSPPPPPSPPPASAASQVQRTGNAGAPRTEQVRREPPAP